MDNHVVDKSLAHRSGDERASSGASAGPRRGRKARLADVALAAGVSQQTVSNVMGGRTGFTEATRLRVLEAAAELDYAPNRAAQRLRTHRSHQLGLHLPGRWLSVREPFAISFLRAATESAERAGQQLVVFTTPLQEQSVRDLVRSGVDGFVLCNVGDDDPRPKVFTELGVPFAIMGRLDSGLPQNCVDIDNAGSMGLVVDHLVERGRRKIAYVGYDSAFHADVERLEGARERLAHHGLSLPRRRVLTATADTAAERVTRRILSRPGVADAIICASDTLAVRVHGAMTKMGLKPGDDMALTGFDGFPLPFDLDPPLTSLRVPIDEATTAVIDLLLKRIDGLPLPVRGLIIPTELAVGGTS